MRTITPAGLVVSMLVASLLPSGGARAQDLGDIVAYFALNSTPPAGFAPVITRTMLGDAQPGADFTFRYGRVDVIDAATNNLALTWMRGGGRGSFGFTAGYWNPDCDDCDGHFVAGLGGDLRLLASSVGTAPSALLLTVGLGAEIGFGKPEGATIWSATLGLPVTLVAGSTSSGVRLAPFVTPGFGWGRISDDVDSESGTRAMLGGGLAIRGSNVGANFGFQKVFIEGGEATFGVNVSFHM